MDNEGENFMIGPSAGRKDGERYISKRQGLMPRKQPHSPSDVLPKYVRGIWGNYYEVIGPFVEAPGTYYLANDIHGNPGLIYTVENGSVVISEEEYRQGLAEKLLELASRKENRDHL